MLSDIRKQMRLSQNQLADLSGVSVRMIQHYEQGSKDIGKAEADTIYKLAQALSCRMEDVIMKNYTVKGNMSSDYTIEGENIIEAIENNFDRIAKNNQLGNAAGYKLEEVTAIYKDGILGAKGGVELEIVNIGLPLANGKEPKSNKVNTVWIYAKKEDLPEPYTFEIKKK